MTDAELARSSGSTPTSRGTSSCARDAARGTTWTNTGSRPSRACFGPSESGSPPSVAAVAPRRRPAGGARARRRRSHRRRLARVGPSFLIVRNEEKEYGTARRVEGVYSAGEEVCLVEDVVTSGGAAASAVEALRSEGLECTTAVCVVDREEAASTRSRAIRTTGAAFPGPRRSSRPEKARKPAFACYLCAPC